MLCAKPFRRGVAEFGCGQCLPCRINRRRLWSTRLMLEATQHKTSLFVTLTYAKEPAGRTLVPEDLQKYLKRLRFAVAPRTVRFYAVGEYGDLRGRPHYHLCLFGELTDLEVVSAWGEPGKCIMVDMHGARKYECSTGVVHIGDVNLESAGYVAGYVVKKMTNGDDARLNGRHPEFCRMSLRPGIGFGAVANMARAVLDESTGELRLQDGKLPSVVRYQGKLLPIGRYLRMKLAKAVHMAPVDKFSRMVAYGRGELALDVGMLVRQLQMGDPSFVAVHEGKKAASTAGAEARLRIARQIKGFDL